MVSEVVGDQAIHGTDKLAGSVARYFDTGRSTFNTFRRQLTRRHGVTSARAAWSPRALTASDHRRCLRPRTWNRRRAVRPGCPGSRLCVTDELRSPGRRVRQVQTFTGLPPAPFITMSTDDSGPGSGPVSAFHRDRAFCSEHPFGIRQTQSAAGLDGGVLLVATFSLT
jgi:hypothetical protein